MRAALFKVTKWKSDLVISKPKYITTNFFYYIYLIISSST